jgi:hypothetical protein
VVVGQVCRWMVVQIGSEVEEAVMMNGRQNRHGRTHDCVAVDHITSPSTVMYYLQNRPPHGREEWLEPCQSD